MAWNKTTEDRFWEKVIKTDSCWLWIAATGDFGHGKFYVAATKRIVMAHRYSYELHIGTIPEGLVVRHMCHNPACVNPAHLELGTQLENIADKKRNRNKGKPKQIKSTKEEKIVKRFWTYVNKDSPKMPHMESNCWEWTGGIRGAWGGYGGYWNGKTNVMSSRYSYELAYGPIAEGNVICHRCDNPKCVRPDHLFEGTHADNSQDRNSKGRQASSERNGRYTHPESTSRGSHRPAAKLTEADVIEMRQKWDNAKDKTDLNKQLMEEYGVSSSVVSNVVNRKSWKHI